METRTITINGHTFVVHAGMRASDLKALGGIAPDRVLIARKPDGTLELVPDHRPPSSPQLIDAPRFIYG
jgi:hypothetical protein